MQPSELANILTFSPESMGQVDRFVMLHGTTFRFTDLESRFLGGVSSHFNKATTLQGLALRLRPGLEIDNREMYERGHSPGLNAIEVSAVVEATILELYSCVDCVAEVIFAIYRHKHIRRLKQSTSGMYRDFDSFGENFPSEIRDALRSTTWFQELRSIRDELTHRQTGTVNLDEKTGSVFYMHHGMKQEDRALIIDDIFVWLGAMVEAINRFLGQLFYYLNSELVSGQVDVVCGFTRGRILMRSINPVEELTFDSGICRSYIWLQQPGNPGCPFAENCGAFKRARAGTVVQGQQPSLGSEGGSR